MFCRGKVTGGSLKVENLYCCQKQSLSVNSGENTCKLNTLKKMNLFTWINAMTPASWLLLQSSSNRHVAKSLLRRQLQKALPASWCSRPTIRCLICFHVLPALLSEIKHYMRFHNMFSTVWILNLNSKILTAGSMCCSSVTLMARGPERK